MIAMKHPPKTLGLVLAATLIAGGVLATSSFAPAYAAAPMVRTQAPGYYRMMLGDFEITALSDGTADLPVAKLLTHAGPNEVARALARSFESSPLESSFNAYLVNTGSKLILIDTGAGKLFGPTLGKLVGNLKAAGYRPEQVDEVYITHMHPDHIGGLAVDGKMVFPNAIVRADRREADYWLSQANLDKAAVDAKSSFQDAMAALKPYIDAHHFSTFQGDTALVPGVSAMAMPGHTTGHTAYVVKSKGKELLVWGDVVHVAAVQFADPAVTIQYDSDERAAAAERRRAYAGAASQGYLIAGAHLPFPGLGHVRTQGKGYAWVPVNYTVPR
jgi:glyoxylase-like metal-dependent hydrolase (beta-lactamase superfamily II)